ncbi:hypothetical protein [Variovorax paradoxus]|uniref:hypothetical protein n=1 Tax=Variovorax paradoxus TaxID=34073 RepID=UPI003D656336
MTNLSRLRVSLTRFGTHKLATLLQHFDSTTILGNLWGAIPGENVERVQAHKTLSVGDDGKVPSLWDDARKAGAETIKGLVMIAIIASHVDLIKALQHGARRPRYQGRILRADGIITDKEFTNFKRILTELGFATKSSTVQVDYDFTELFKIPKLNLLAAKLFALKLKTARWDESNSLEDELIALGFHKAFSIDAASFRAWLTAGASAPALVLTTEDADFFEATDEKLPSKPFKFKAGHLPKKVGKVKITAPTSDAEAELLHNAMQTKLYDELIAVHGKACVGTENSSGSGTAIDLVVQAPAFRWFYEIKTAGSVKACIRQGIPQLLEYAYWQCVLDRAQKLIIVGPKPITVEGEAYLDFLRNSFGLELYYEHCAV